MIASCANVTLHDLHGRICSSLSELRPFRGLLSNTTRSKATQSVILNPLLSGLLTEGLANFDGLTPKEVFLHEPFGAAEVINLAIKPTT